MPKTGIQPLSRSAILCFEEIEAVARAGAELGVNSLRLTGGEPLARSGIADLADRLACIQGVGDLAITTNGCQFAQNAAELSKAGLKRVNFGIPSLDPEKYRLATRIGCLKDALAGLDAAIQFGFFPIKVNVVVMRGINSGLEDFQSFVQLATQQPIQVRFIEYMPIGDGDHGEYFVPASEILKALNEIPDFHVSDCGCWPDIDMPGAGPAKNAWSIPKAFGSIGILAPVSGHICGQCNRLRLTADGHLRPCLFSEKEISLKPALRPLMNSDHLTSLFLDAVAKKPKCLQEITSFGRKMSQIGG